MSYKGKVNRYACAGGHRLWTQDKDDGVTPFMVACPAPGCGRLARSSMYRVPQSLSVAEVGDWVGEWGRPTAERAAALSAGERDHVEMGGLLLANVEVVAHD